LYVDCCRHSVPVHTWRANQSAGKLTFSKSAATRVNGLLCSMASATRVLTAIRYRPTVSRPLAH